MIPAKPNMGYVNKDAGYALIEVLEKLIEVLEKLIEVLEKQVAQLKRKVIVWNDCKRKMPEFNKGVLVFIPDEDNHITSGMWDISEKWVLLDEYRTPESEVTYWADMPEPPK